MKRLTMTKQVTMMSKIMMRMKKKRMLRRMMRRMMMRMMKMSARKMKRMLARKMMNINLESVGFLTEIVRLARRWEFR